MRQAASPTRMLHLPPLYPITDRQLSGLSHAEQVARFAAGGARLVQLREKHLAPRDFYHEAAEALRVARALGVLLIINDRVDLALALGADGVHLGQDDLPPAAARALLGAEAIIGFSTHNVEQAAAAAARWPIDYLAIGPVAETATKENPDPVVGVEGVRRVRQAVGGLPLVAIGGIGRANALSVLEAGADCVAVIGALLAAPALITERTAELLDLLGAAR